MSTGRPKQDAPLAFTAGATEAGATVGAALRARLDGISWSTVKRLIATGKVSIGGTLTTDAARRLRAGEQVAYDPRARAAAALPPLPLRIVFDDPHVVVVDKPSGVSSVPFEKRESGTAMDLLREAWRREGGKRVTQQPLFVVHRIDKETSGLLTYAKTKAAERALAMQFRTHAVGRLYLCVVHGALTSRRIESMLVRDRGDGRRGSARHPTQQGKRAVTHVEALGRLGDRATLCRVRLETGKTHQIRIHLSEAGHPIIGERVYIRETLPDGSAPLPSPRLLLHAATLGFAHPKTGERIELESLLPESFRKAAKKATGAELPERIAYTPSSSSAMGGRRPGVSR